MQKEHTLEEINAFEAQYQYDSTYLREMIESSPMAYEAFAQASALSRHRELLDEETFWLVKLATFQSEDCGQCLQLNVRMALDAQMPKSYIETILYRPDLLPPEQNDLYRYVRCVADNSPCDENIKERIRNRLNKGQLIEIGLCIASATLYPAIKRAMGYSQSCALLDLEM